MLRKDQNDCFQRLFKYPPIESPVTLIKLANQIKDLLFKSRKKKELKSNNIKKENGSANSSTISNNKPKPTISDLLKTQPENNNTINISKAPKKSPVNSSDDTAISFSPIIKQNVGSTVTIPTKNINNTEEEYVKLVLRLEEIYKKYKTSFDQDDSSDFESILETLKTNINNTD